MAAQLKATVRTALVDERNEWSTDTSINFAGDSGFDAATLRWNAHDAPEYVASITVTTEADVVKAVKLARAHGIPFLATGSRHSYGTTMSSLKGGFAIDLSQLSSLSVDKAAASITIGPGVTNEDIVGPVHEAGFETPTGSCSTVSVIGATLGAGISRWSGVYGLLIDSLLLVRLITADGNVMEASATSNPDLFWAIKGAGANFGIVVSATYRLQKPINQGKILNADFMLPADMKSGYFNLLRSLSEKGLPAELAINTAVVFDPGSSSTLVGGNWAWLGQEDEGRQVIEQLLALKPPIINVSILSWTELTKTAGFGGDAMICPKGRLRSLYATNVRQFSVSAHESAVEKMVQFYDEHPDGRGSMVIFEKFANHAVKSVPDDTACYPWRDVTEYAMFQFSWAEAGSPTAAAANTLGAQLRQEFSDTSGYPDLAVYVSYAHGDETLEQRYGKEKLHRLAALKNRYDPDNVFCYHHPLPAQYP
ncbi:putative FAD-binding PCMH-type domain-containing protein [Seiridium cardinale]